MRTVYVDNLRQRRIPTGIGGKARNLRALIDQGFKVPETYVIVCQAYQRYLDDDAGLITALHRELEAIIDPQRVYAVRSSAEIEDSPALSFAGQFKTVLDAKGVDAILQAVWSVWATAKAPAVQSYAAHRTSSDRDLHMAVIVQEMVSPRFSGVAFSRNPMTGEDEVIVEAVEGAGTALAQAGITPMRWVNKWGIWKAKPETAPVPIELVEQIIAHLQQMTRSFGKYLDAEWVFDGKDLYWVQVRQITAFGKPDIYSNRIAKEMLPGIIKPLVWSVNIPLVNTVWVNLLDEMVGKTGIQPEDLAKSFYYRTYFNMGAFGRVFAMAGLPEEGLEIMMGLAPPSAEKPSFKPTLKTLTLLPRLVRFAWHKWTIGGRYRRAMAELAREVASFELGSIATLSEADLLGEIDRLYQVVQRVAYYNVVIPLLMLMFNGVLRSILGKAGYDFAQLDLTEGLLELLDYDPNVHIAALHDLYAELPEDARAEIHQLPGERSLTHPEAIRFQQQLSEFVRRFGHLSDSGNDFSAVPWRENPQLILELVANYVRTESASQNKVRFGSLAFPLFQRWIARLFYQRARAFRLYREQVSSKYTYSYGLFRAYFLEVGRRLRSRGVLLEPADIFYLSYAEVQRAINNGAAVESFADVVAERKLEIEHCRDIVTPTIIYGNEAPPLQEGKGQTLIGTGTSRGYYTGRVKVVRSLKDFSKVEDGDVLVIPYSDVGWTPLFARAGAVIAESGGILSHSSIVAREYGIPAVVSVSDALALDDGTLVTVDGFRGEVLVRSETHAEV